jgi:hypothetical protein
MKHPWFVRGDIDGFFGLFIDNLTPRGRRS